ncbi:hypothetical protein BV898_11569 [Hypsibius exemplaris]|uniref:Tetraspanin n=1 Tax=Hypsibius exemplaris TaxID=2072580 RepID=A0A1W0WG78_HYPEX|nr:hypothetical protein BV898_11569 [Hypsibius exemplaris]
MTMMDKQKRNPFNIIRTILLGTSFLFSAAGLALVGVALWMYVGFLRDWAWYYAAGATSLHDPILGLIAVGWALLLLAILQTFGALRAGSPKLLSFCLVLVLAIVGCLIAVTIVTHGQQQRYSRNEERDEMAHKALGVYQRKSQGFYQIDEIQQRFECCGLTTWADWEDPTLSLLTRRRLDLTSGHRFPFSCCRNNNRTACFPPTTQAAASIPTITTLPVIELPIEIALNNASDPKMTTTQESTLFTVGCGVKFTDAYLLMTKLIYIASGSLVGLLLTVYVLSAFLGWGAFYGNAF